MGDTFRGVFANQLVCFLALFRNPPATHRFCTIGHLPENNASLLLPPVVQTLGEDERISSARAALCRAYCPRRIRDGVPEDERTQTGV